MVTEYKDIKIGDIVYHKTDPDQTKKLVVGFLFREDHVLIECSENGEWDYYFYNELSKEKAL